MRSAAFCEREAPKQVTRTRLPRTSSASIANVSPPMSTEEISSLLENIFTQESPIALSSSAPPVVLDYSSSTSILDDIIRDDLSSDNDTEIDSFNANSPTPALLDVVDTSASNISVMTLSSSVTPAPTRIARRCGGGLWCTDTCPVHVMCVIPNANAYSGVCGNKRPCTTV